MASSEHPHPAHLITEGPAETPVPLPPLPRTQPIDPTKFLRRRSWLDALIVAVVLLFSFLVVSFPAVNTDFFRHAAIGRLILNGEYHFGVDPFVYTVGDTYFVNHSWLFDILLYGLYQLPSGGAIVVIVKALLTAVLAEVLLRASRRAGQSLWIPAVCTALAILVASPRLYLSVQSTCLSFLFLGVTIWLLTDVGRSDKRLWLLPPLFVLWVNCDSWFFLGPLTVALYLLGELLQSKTHQPAAPARASLGGARGWLVLLVGLAACLLNPHHVHAFQLPPEFGLTAAGGLLEQDQQFYPLFLSPCGSGYYNRYTGGSVAGWAYWLLVLLSLASFAALFKRVSWPRLLVWLPFALLSLYNWRAIPFFAIVAGPIMALNWLDFVALRLGAEPRLTTGARSWALAGRALTLLLGLVLLLATVPGWLQKSLPYFHRIGWSVQVDPSLREMAEAIRGWRQAGLLPDEPHWFNMSYAVANYLAWFAPGEQVFLDQSLPNFRTAAEEYLAVRQGLEQEAERDSAGVKTDWRKILSDRQVRFWIYDNIGGRTADSVSQAILFTRQDEWVLCHLKGRIAIFARRDPQRPESDPSPRLALDLKRSAFGAEAAQAPQRGPEPASPSPWWRTVWEVWWRPDPAPTSDREVLSLYDYRYQAVERPEQVYATAQAWRAAVAAAAAAGSIPGGPAPSSLLTFSWSCTYNDLFPPGSMQPVRQPRKSEELSLQVFQNYLNSQFIESPSLYLAVRSARRAVLADPEYGPTYFRLGQTYQRLRELPQESLLRRMPQQMAPALLDSLRRTQMIAAYQTSLRFPLDDEKAAEARKAAEAHVALYRIYVAELGYIDAAAHHLHLALEMRTAAGPPPGVSPSDYSQALDNMSSGLTRLESELDRRMNRYEVNAASKSGLEKAMVALQEGLCETALSVLEQETDVNNITSQTVSAVKMMASLALDLGRTDEASLLLQDTEGEPVKPEELELYLRLAAARGNYAEADRLLEDALRHAWQPPPGQLRMPDSIAKVAPLVGRILLAEARHLLGSPCVPWVPNDLDDILKRPWIGHNPSDFWRRRWRLEAIIDGLLAARQQGEWELVRGWLALEAGRCVEAQQHFQTAHDLAVPGNNWVPEVSQLNAWLNDQAEKTGLQQVSLRHAILFDQSSHYLNWLKEASKP